MWFHDGSRYTWRDAARRGDLGVKTWAASQIINPTVSHDNEIRLRPAADAQGGWSAAVRGWSVRRRCYPGECAPRGGGSLTARAREIPDRRSFQRPGNAGRTARK